MAEYKCINCGEIRESEKPCNCLICGAKMFAMPYDRKQMLIQEIRRLTKAWEINEIQDEDLLYTRMQGEEQIFKSDDDEKRFPTIRTIYDYALNAEKTESFLNRLEETLTEFNTYISSSYTREYLQYTDELKQRLAICNGVLSRIMISVGKQWEPQTVSFPAFAAKYEEHPDEDWCPSIEELLDTLSLLVEKVRKFIKKNNIYGATFRVTGIKSSKSAVFKRRMNCKR